MIKIRILFSIVILFGVYLMSCKHTPKEVTPEPSTTDTSVNNDPGSTGIPCDPDTVYYSEIQAILTSSCTYAGCHNAVDKPDGINLTNYNSVIQTADVRAGNLAGSDLYEVITETDPDKIMPPPPYNKLSDDQISKIRTWILQGAKNNRCDGCDTVDVKYSSQVTKIINANCFSCHNNNLANSGISLEGYSNVLKTVNSGSLLGTISHASGYIPMPYQRNKLSDCDINIIQKWINEGAQDN